MSLGVLLKQPENGRTPEHCGPCWGGLGSGGLSSRQDTRASRKCILTAELIAVHVSICSFFSPRGLVL